jgi:hypothetical protein
LFTPAKTFNFSWFDRLSWQKSVSQPFERRNMVLLDRTVVNLPTSAFCGQKVKRCCQTARAGKAVSFLSLYSRPNHAHIITTMCLTDLRHLHSLTDMHTPSQACSLRQISNYILLYQQQIRLQYVAILTKINTSSSADLSLERPSSSLACTLQLGFLVISAAALTLLSALGRPTPHSIANPSTPLPL